MGGFNPNQKSGVAEVDRYIQVFTKDLFELHKTHFLAQHRLSELGLEEARGNCKDAVAYADLQANYARMVVVADKITTQNANIQTFLMQPGITWQTSYIQFYGGKIGAVRTLANDLLTLINGNDFVNAADNCTLQQSLWGNGANKDVRIKSIDLTEKLDEMMDRHVEEVRSTNM